MSNPQRDRGHRAEREVAAILSDLLGVTVRRKLQEGRLDDGGDLEGLVDTCAQVKNYVDILRAIREALADLPAQMAASGSTHGVAFIRRPGGRYMAVMPVEAWCAMYRETLP